MFVRVAALVATLLVAGVASQAAAAGDAAAIPFTPPATWQMLPASFIPKTLVTWAGAGSSFGVSQSPVAVPIDQMIQGLTTGASAFGKIESANTVSICGEPAAVIVVQAPDSATMTEQVQSIGGTTFFSIYRRPASSPVEPALTTLMAGFCGEKSLVAAEPPPGWQSHEIRMLGIWLVSPLQTISAIAMDPRPNAADMATDALGTTIKTPNVTIVSKSSGTLCGNPAQFFTAKAKPAGLDEITVELEMTQSASVAYMLSYTYPSGSTPDPSAEAALKTLCAPNGAPATAPVPAAAPSPAASATP
jgi:hypothetical protein